MSRPIINFYAPSEPATPKLPTLATSPDPKFLYVTYKGPNDNSATLKNFYLPPQPPHHDEFALLSQRRGAVDHGSSTRSPLSAVNFHAESIRRTRVLPQKILNPPRSENAVQSIWFKPKHLGDGAGVAMVDMLEGNAVDICRNPGDVVFNDFVVPNSEIKFNILWPGYGHVSWMASIPTVIHDNKGKSSGGITRSALAIAVSQHFQAFMTYHSTLRFAHPEPCWRIDDDGGIRFNQLRLSRLFCCDENGPDCDASWQAEVLVVDI